MGASNPRSACAVSNPVRRVDSGTSALVCTDAPCSTGRPVSISPDGLWAEIVSSPLHLATQDKVYTLSHNLQLFARLQGNVELTAARINQQSLVNPDRYLAYAEQMQARKQWVDAIGQSRRIVKELNAYELDLSQEQLEDLKGYLNKKLLEAAPYYTQMANLNLLADGNKAWTRTCNVTSLSMALEALGVHPEDFKGNFVRLQRIADTLEMWRYKNDKGGVGASCYPDVKTLRLPDFLQFVAVYIMFDIRSDDLRGNAYLKKVQEARDTAAKKIILYETLTKIAALFGVKCSKTLGVASYGQKEIGIEKNIHSLDKRMEKLSKNTPATMSDNLDQGDQNLSEYYKAKGGELDEKAKLADLQKDFSQPGKMDQGVRAYQRQILEKIAPELVQGNQVFLHKPGVVSGHYMKLHKIERTDIDSVGLFIDDPWTPGKRSQLTWRQAFKEGYFDSYMVLSKE
jgi:hypothetical protein